MTETIHETTQPIEQHPLTEADVRGLLAEHRRDIEAYIDAKLGNAVTRAELEAAMTQQGNTTDAKLANFTASIQRVVGDMLSASNTQTNLQLSAISDGVRMQTTMIQNINESIRKVEERQLASEKDIRDRRAQIDERLRELEESNDTIRARQDDTEHRFGLVTQHVMGDERRGIPSLSEQIRSTLNAVNTLSAQQQQTAMQMEAVYKVVLRIRRYAATRFGRAVIAGGFLLFAGIVAIIDRVVLSTVLGG